jgi:hypothetical protein
VHRWFYAQEAYKGGFRAHTLGVEELVNKGTLSPCSGRSPPLQNLLEMKREKTVRYIICASGALKTELLLPTHSNSIRWKK